MAQAFSVLAEALQDRYVLERELGSGGMATVYLAQGPAALIRFSGEYHGTSSKPSNFIRTQLYMMSWYQRWSRGTATTATAGQ